MNNVYPLSAENEIRKGCLDTIEGLLERIAVALEALAGTSVPVPEPQKVDEQDTGQEAPSTGAPTLEALLNARQITIKHLRAPHAADELLDRLALFLGERYEALADLLHRIKRTMASGRSFTMNIKDLPQTDISSVCQLCSMLHQVALLTRYNYLKSPRYLITATPSREPRVQNFFSGHWLERFILLKVEAIAEQMLGSESAFESMINPQIVLPNGDDFELDVLARVGDSVFWIEGKTGQYQQHVAKYSRFARLLGLDEESSFMVLTDVSEDQCRELTALYSLNVCPVQHFEAVFRQSLETQNGSRAAA